ncbi:MAG: DUF167 family protein, partial [Candidatus Pacearchaeota archaeon]
ATKLKMIIKVKVKSNSEKQDIIKEDEGYLVYVKSPAENGKANLELLKLLKKHFKKEIKIKAGKTSRNKVIEVGVKIENKKVKQNWNYLS